MSTKVRDGVRQQRLAHSKVLCFPGEGLLIDTGPESEWEGLRSFVEDSGGIDRVFLSHAHGDHFGNIERIVETFDADVLCPVDEPLDDTPLDDGDYLADGVKVVTVPGHTPGISALYLENHEVLLATDVLDGSDRRGLPAGYLLPPPDLYNWDAAKAELNLGKLLELEFDTAVVTHGLNVNSDADHKLEKYLNFPDHYRADLL